MFKLNVWVKENGTPVRYIREAETIAELWEELTMDLDLTDIIEIHISKSI